MRSFFFKKFDSLERYADVGLRYRCSVRGRLGGYLCIVPKIWDTDAGVTLLIF